jgi:hypothetical protein
LAVKPGNVPIGQANRKGLHGDGRLGTIVAVCSDLCYGQDGSITIYGNQKEKALSPAGRSSVQGIQGL